MSSNKDRLSSSLTNPKAGVKADTDDKHTCWLGNHNNLPDNDVMQEKFVCYYVLLVILTL